MSRRFIKSLLPRTVRCHRIWGGPYRGRRIVGSWHDCPRAILGRMEPHLIRWFEANVRGGETWLDVGAHHGYTALALSHLVGEQGRVFAFEALPRTAGHLAATKVANRLRQMIVVPLGLGDVEKITRVETTVSINGMADRTVSNDRLRESMYVVALDQVWEQLCAGDDTISGVKMDIQGMEIEALRGMAKLLRRHQPKLAVEIHAGVDREELLELLAGLGYARAARPIEPLPGEESAQLYDNRNYQFVPEKRES